MCFRKGGVGHAVAVSPADERGGIYEWFAAVVNGGVSSVEGVADEAGLLFRYYGRVGEIQENGERGRDRRWFGGSPGDCEIQGSGFGVEETLKLGEEAEQDGRDFAGGRGWETEGLNGRRVAVIERKVGIEGDPSGFPDGWVTAPIMKK